MFVCTWMDLETRKSTGGRTRSRSARAQRLQRRPESRRRLRSRRVLLQAWLRARQACRAPRGSDAAAQRCRPAVPAMVPEEPACARARVRFGRVMCAIDVKASNHDFRANDGEEILVTARNCCCRSDSSRVTVSMLRLPSVLDFVRTTHGMWPHARMRFCDVASCRDIPEDCLVRTHTRARRAAHKDSMHDTHARDTHPHTIRWCRYRELETASSLAARDATCIRRRRLRSGS